MKGFPVTLTNRTAALLAVVAFSTLGPPGQRAVRSQSASPGERDITAVRLVWSTLDAAWNARDEERFSRQFTNDGSLGFVSLGQALEGRAAIRQHFSDQFPRYPPDVRHVTQLRAIHVVAPDVIGIDGDVEILGKGPEGRKEPTVVRRFVVSAVMLRTVDGWSIRLLRAYQLQLATGIAAQP